MNAECLWHTDGMHISSSSVIPYSVSLMVQMFPVKRHSCFTVWAKFLSFSSTFVHAGVEMMVPFTGPSLHSSTFSMMRPAALFKWVFLSSSIAVLHSELRPRRLRGWKV